MKTKKKYQFGGNLPGATGMMYARTGSTPSNGKYAKKTKPSAQNGKRVVYSNPNVNDDVMSQLTSLGAKVQHSNDFIGDSQKKYGDLWGGYDYIDIDPNIPLNKYPKKLQEFVSTADETGNFPSKMILKHYADNPPVKQDTGFQYKPYYASYKDVPKKQKGGVIEDDMGQYNHPGKITKIKSNRITMKDVSYPVLGVSDTGHKQIMHPEGEYAFDGSSVTEYPMTRQDMEQLKKLDDLTNFTLMGKSGIHIKPENKGKFTAYKKRTGKTTEEALHSKDPHVRQMANFARNAKKWHHGQDGLMLDNLQNYTSSPVDSSIMSLNQKGPNPNLSALGGAKPQGLTLDSIGGIGGAIGIGTDLLQGAQMLKQEKNQRRQMKQFAALSGVVNQAASTRPEKVKRKYARPEDMNFDPNELSKSYGSGTNFLAAKNGTSLSNNYEPYTLYTGLEEVPKAQFGMAAGSLGSAAGSKLFGGTGEQSGAGKIGSVAGSTIGNLILPGIGGTIGGALGGFVGGAIGAKNQKETKKYENQGFANIQNAAFQQGTAAMQNQYSGFMRTGGHIRENIMAMGGELQTHWGGEAEHVSENKFLPDGGQSVLFRGQSHDDGGIGVTFGKNPVEVEGGEPAVKLQDGGTGDNNLVVFGNMKIPSYGVSEIGDEKAKGKKFKNYINDLNKIEARQNNVVEKGTNLVNDTPTSNPYDKLKFNSGQAMMTGGNMKLKDIAQKKQMTSIVQNAILETAEEHGLESDALAKGKIKKSKFGGKFSFAQKGKTVPYVSPEVQDAENDAKYKSILHDLTEGSGIPKSIPSSYKDAYKKYGWMEDPENNRLYKDFMTPGKGGTLKTAPGGKQGDEESYWNKFLIPQLKKGISPEELVAKKYMSKGAIDRAKQYYTPNPGKTDTKYITIQDDYLAPPDSPVNGGTPPEEATTVAPPGKGPGWENYLNAYLPYLRPSNKLKLDPNQLSGEMYALATNQLEPVQAQLYRPLLENVSDISLQDQMNANQADFNSIQRQVGNNPAALSTLAAQKYAANSGVLGEQFRQNQNQRMGVYNRNRGVLNDATLKNLGILDQQYVRQSQAKSNTKAQAQAALNSISDKIAKNKLENKTLGVYENLYNYRFGPNGRAWNMNGLAQFDTGVNPKELQQVDNNGNIIHTEQNSVTRDRYGNVKYKQEIDRTTTSKKAKKSTNGSIIKALKNY